MFPGLDLPYKANPAQPFTTAGDDLSVADLSRLIYLSEVRVA